MPLRLLRLGLGLACLAAAAALVAVVAYWSQPRRPGPGGGGAADEGAAEPAPVAGQEASAGPNKAQPGAGTAYAGEIVRGLQLIARADRQECGPGEAVTFTWELVNHTGEPLACQANTPEVHIAPRDPAKLEERSDLQLQRSVFGTGQRTRAGPRCELPPRGGMTFDYLFTWPREVQALVTERGTGSVMRRLQNVAFPAGEFEVTLVYTTVGTAPPRPPGVGGSERPPAAAQAAAWEGQVQSAAIPMRVTARASVGGPVKGRKDPGGTGKPAGGMSEIEF